MPLVQLLLQYGLSPLALQLEKSGVEWLNKLTGLNLSTDTTSISEVVALQLKQAQLDNEDSLTTNSMDSLKLRIQEEQLFLADTQSARTASLALETSDKVPLMVKIIAPALAILVTIATFAIWIYMIVCGAPADNKDLFMAVLGASTAQTTQILQFYFGSSIGSKDKSDMLAKLGGSHNV